MKKSIKETLKTGEYYIWNIHFSDGGSTRVKITSDYIDQAALEKHFGKPISKIDYSFGIHGGPTFDQDAADEYHRQQDELEKRRKLGAMFEGEELAPGDKIRTKKMSTFGVIEQIKDTPIGRYVFFRTEDGKLLKTPITNVQLDAQTEGSMGGINRSAPAWDVSYERVLDDSVEGTMDKKVEESVEEIFKEVYEKWINEQDTTAGVQQGPIGFVIVDPKSDNKILYRYNATQRGRAISMRDKLDNKYGAYRYQIKTLYPGEEHLLGEEMHRWTGYSKDDKKAKSLDKAPKSAMMGSKSIKLSELVRDSIEQHGLEWAFKYYVEKHGLPSRQFEIFAGVEPGYFDQRADHEPPVDKNRAFGEPTSPIKGSVTTPFNKMVADAIRIKGFDWAKDYFVNKRGIPEWEFNMFAGKPSGLGTKE